MVMLRPREVRGVAASLHPELEWTVQSNKVIYRTVNYGN
jgi:hypothetical protein